MAPPPLCDRPLLAGPDRRRSDELTTFYLGGGEGGGDDDAGALGQAVAPVEARAVEPGDYFAVQLTRRPALPRSRWSESTVATVESSLAAADDDTVRGSDDDAQEPEELDGGGVDVIGHYYLPPAKPVDGHRSMPNFSHKRDTLPKRPPIKTLDSLEDFIKRGGWKRRGIVFHSEEMRGDTDELHLGFDADPGTGTGPTPPAARHRPPTAHRLHRSRLAAHLLIGPGPSHDWGSAMTSL